MDTDRGCALIVGAGDALGSALAHKFAREGLIACVVRRDAAKLYPLKLEIEALGSRCETFLWLRTQFIRKKIIW